MDGRRMRWRARDNYDNHFVCEPRAKETGQNEEDDAYDFNRMERWMMKKMIMMTRGNRFSETPQVLATVGRLRDDDISVVVVVIVN